MNSSQFMLRFQKKRGTLRTDLIQIIAQKTQRPFMQIYKLVEAWNEDMLKDSIILLEKEGPVAWWAYRKKTLN